MNASALLRPEQRRRRAPEGPAPADEVPAHFPSEGFAEDLLEIPARLPAPSRPHGPPGQQHAQAETAQSAG